MWYVHPFLALRSVMSSGGLKLAVVGIFIPQNQGFPPPHPHAQLLHIH